AVMGDRVMAVGPSDRIAALAGPGTRRLDVGGRSVVPGFVDTHVHLDREGLRRAYPDLQACRSIADVQAVVRRAVARVPPGESIVLLPGGQRHTTSRRSRAWPSAASRTATISTRPRPTTRCGSGPSSGSGTTRRPSSTS